MDSKVKMNNVPKYARLVLTVILPLILAGCGHSLKPYAAKELKARDGARMAILPFDNLSKTQGAGKSMENIVLIEFLKNSPIKIVDPGEVAVALSEERVRLATSIPRETVQAIGKKLGVELFLLGIVHEFEMQTSSSAGGSGPAPVIAMTVRIINAGTGEIVWASNATRSGKDSETLFGVGKVDSLNKLAENTAKDLAEAFAASFQK